MTGLCIALILCALATAFLIWKLRTGGLIENIFGNEPRKNILNELLGLIVYLGFSLGAIYAGFAVLVIADIWLLVLSIIAAPPVTLIALAAIAFSSVAVWHANKHGKYGLAKTKKPNR